MDALPAITQLSEDFSNQNAPFNEAELPEQEALDTVDSSDELEVLAYGVMLDYNRNAAQLWDNILELYEQTPEYFDASDAAICNLDEMQETFEEIGFRYHHRDAKAWRDNSQILCDEFSGSWYRLLDKADFDAVRLSSMIEDAGFKYLKGDKLCPFFIKVVDMNIASIERVWQLEIPVDVHIRRLSIKLIGEDVDDDEIRAYWRELGQDYGVEPMVADTALWLIGNKWSDWGENYWNSLTNL